MIKVLIIEDEIKTARELKMLIETLRTDMQVIEIIQSVKAGIRFFQEQQNPDLILSDIQLADGLSFNIFKESQVHGPIIFCTAFDEYAIRAFETNGIDYLLKPVDERKLQQSLEKYEKLKASFNTGTGANSYEATLTKLFTQLKPHYKSTLLVHHKEKIIPVKTAEIAFIHYNNGIIHIYTANNQRYVITAILDELEATLDPLVFFRANRQFIINRQFIVEVEHYFTRRLTVRISIPTPEAVIISKVKASEFLHWMETA